MAVKTNTRLYFVDYLRAAIITLVILHHVAVTYAANTPFYYVESPSDTVSLIILLFFELFNQAWFMGFFFLLSGYFTPSSFDRKGPRQFLKDRLIRLGIPLLVFAFVISPLVVYIGVPRISPALLAKASITVPALNWQNYFSFVSPGPFWFVALLFIFDLGYATWRVASAKRKKVEGAMNPTLNYRTVALFILGLAAVSYLVRIVIPLGRYVWFFPSFAYLPQYLSFFLIGVLAIRRDWLRSLSSSMAKHFFVVAVIASVFLFPFTLAGGHFLGNGSWQSGVYALWDSIFAVGMSTGLIVFFRRYYDLPGRLWRFFSQQYYAVYFIHILVIVSLSALVLSSIALESLLKFGLAAVIAVPLCWVVAYLIRKIPLVDKVL